MMDLKPEVCTAVNSNIYSESSFREKYGKPLMIAIVAESFSTRISSQEFPSSWIYIYVCTCFAEGGVSMLYCVLGLKSLILLELSEQEFQ